MTSLHTFSYTSTISRTLGVFPFVVAFPWWLLLFFCQQICTEHTLSTFCSNWLVVCSWLLCQYLVGSSLPIVVAVYQVLSKLTPKSGLWLFLIYCCPDWLHTMSSQILCQLTYFLKYVVFYFSIDDANRKLLSWINDRFKQMITSWLNYTRTCHDSFQQTNIAYLPIKSSGSVGH